MPLSSEDPPLPKRRHPANRAPEVVKSAVRVLEVLEFFDTTRAPACVGMVAAGLNFPQSSTSALLRSLVKVGYLSYNPQARTYFPTRRVPLLGNWIGHPLFRSGPVLDMVERLAQSTGCTVVLARCNGSRAQYMHVADARDAIPSGVKIGLSLPLPGCAIGQVLLAAMSEAEQRRLLHRLNAEAQSQDVVRITDFMSRLALIRSSGFALAADPFCTVLALRLPLEATEEPLVLGLAGPADELEGRCTALLAILQAEVRSSLRPLRRTLASFDVPAAFALPAARSTVQHVAG